MRGGSPLACIPGCDFFCMMVVLVAVILVWFGYGPGHKPPTSATAHPPDEPATGSE